MQEYRFQVRPPQRYVDQFEASLGGGIEQTANFGRMLDGKLRRAVDIASSALLNPAGDTIGGACKTRLFSTVKKNSLIAESSETWW